MVTSSLNENICSKILRVDRIHNRVICSKYRKKHNVIQWTSKGELNKVLFHKTLVVNLEFMSPFPCVSILSKLIHLFLSSCCFIFHFGLFILVVVATILMLWSWKFCTRPVLPCKVCKQNLLSSYTKNCSLSTHMHSKI